MTLHPGSVGWLLRHEIRMYFSNLRKLRANGKQSSRWLNHGLLAVFQLALHFGAYKLAPLIERIAIPGHLQAPLLLIGLFALLTWMLSAALRGAVDALFERGDMDLLLSSPLPAASIFFARLLGIAISVAGVFLFFLAPLANIGLLTGRPGWLAIYVVVIALALLVSSLAMLLTLALVRLLGARRTRTLAHVLSALVGALMFLLSQAFNSSSTLGAPLKRWLAEGNWTPVLTLTHGVFTHPFGLPALLATGVAVFLLTVRSTRNFFVRGVQQAAGASKAARAPRGGVRWRFDRSFAWTMIIKEWRLMLRDTRLMSQVLLRLLYLLPLCLVVFKSTAGTTQITGAALVFVCCSLAGTLAWITMAAEDAPDLLASAPRRAAELVRAKLIAAAAPPLALVAAPALWVLSKAPLAGLITVTTLLLGTLTTVYIVLWSAPAANRADFSKRGTGANLGSFLQALNAMAWAATAGLLLMGISYPRFLPWTALALGVALVMLGLAWSRDGDKVAQWRRAGKRPKQGALYEQSRLRGVVIKGLGK
ncbi:MAG: hypothetical protein ABW202_05040 [Duganella sp.]